ncbi:aminodeoxychorismate synthase component I [Uliginosibacterium gangwonense]|uniref:aminodeoxychorismate synthase component I n=1 Tax=Uliginosibacterium gangwonense TaxID=392736 RepID=UPI00037C1721|nr:aminodeoxychorismate synthase component I [Uliginosibacterium gangwonense]
MFLLAPLLYDLPYFALFEDSLSEAPSLCLLHGLQAQICVCHPDELAPALRQIEEAQAQGHWVAWAAEYELGLALEPRLQALLPADTRLLRAWIFREKTTLGAEAVAGFWQQQLAGLSPQACEAGLLRLEPEWVEAEHAQATRNILELIAAGDCYQVNLTMPFTGVVYGHPLALYARLRERQPVRYSTLIRAGDEWVLSLSPELFVERQGDTLSCRPMKGTAPRHLDPVRDKAEGAALLASEKNRAENLMIVDLIRNDLGRLVAAGGVRTTALFTLEAYATVYQLTSTVQASPVRASLETILRAIFPCGSITGAPKIRAMEIIHQLETTPRGVYCGALGWVAPDGDFRFSVPIRTLLVAHDGACRLNAGGGIVADSRPAEEYQECLIKARFARSLAEEYQLIETLRWSAEEGFPLLAEHKARLVRSAHELGFVCDEGAIESALHLHVAGQAERALRVRLLLWRDGSHQIQGFPLEALQGEQSVCISAVRLDPADRRLRYKTTARKFYDAALQQATAASHFDVIFFNTRGELCEGARSNIFIERDGVLLTPVLSSGLLPGVLRAHLLARGQAREAVLREPDLRNAGRVWLGNALRGLVPVRLA